MTGSVLFFTYRFRGGARSGSLSNTPRLPPAVRCLTPQFDLHNPRAGCPPRLAQEYLPLINELRTRRGAAKAKERLKEISMQADELVRTPCPLPPPLPCSPFSHAPAPFRVLL
jgi:hypothetical protein